MLVGTTVALAYDGSLTVSHWALGSVKGFNQTFFENPNDRKIFQLLLYQVRKFGP